MNLNILSENILKKKALLVIVRFSDFMPELWEITVVL